MKKTFSDLQAVLFDLDGTLIDSIGRYLMVLNTAFRELKIPPVSERLASEAVKEGDIDWDMLLPDLPQEKKRQVCEALPQTIAGIYDRVFDHRISLIPGVENVIPALSNCGFMLAIVTSTPRIHLSPKLHPLHESNLIRYFREIL
ncbi:MAG: HAD hydrolase-like protein, partial [Thermodesulfobacteriota bacterium]